jgi:PRTRC genetic system protein C
MAKIETVPRVFKIGPTVLEDPDPESTPEAALQLYAPSHPALAHCTLSEPRLEGDRLVYEVVRPTATTKGRAGSSAQDALDQEIASWEAEWAGRHQDLADPEVVKQAVAYLKSSNRAFDKAKRGSSVPLVDSTLIPMC